MAMETEMEMEMEMDTWDGGGNGDAGSRTRESGCPGSGNGESIQHWASVAKRVVANREVHRVGVAVQRSRSAISVF